MNQAEKMLEALKKIESLSKKQPEKPPIVYMSARTYFDFKLQSFGEFDAIDFGLAWHLGQIPEEK